MSGECASVSRRGCALGAGSAASRVPRLREAGRCPDPSSPLLPRPDLGARAERRERQGQAARASSQR